MEWPWSARAPARYSCATPPTSAVTGVELKTLLQETLARMAAKDPATGGLLSGPSTAMRRRTHPFPSHANTLPKWGRRKKHHAPFSPHCKSAGKAAVAVARDQVDELGAALAPFPHDLASVDRLQLDTMGDADDGCAGLRG